ncbi:MAG: glycosyl hydrolase family 28 protein [Eubacteriales bacterium]|nr:glycosyl hydrolase family 28 protein [Eubacteriales bacterium]
MWNILDYGAQPGQDCTQAIQAAIDAADPQEGTVCIPKGDFHTGTLNLKNTSLYLARGARLIASRRIEDYVFNGYEHNEMGKTYSLLYAMHTRGTRLYGQGTIDLSGDAFYDFDRRSVPQSAVELTPAQVAECTATYTRRPTQPVFFYDCRDISVEGIRIENAPCWTLTFVECRDIRVTDITIDNDLRIPNNDGIHFCSCKGAFVRGCHICAGDDCIAVTSITNWDIPCEEITISDCQLRSCSKAIVVGYMHGIARNVTVSNCVILSSNRAIAIMSSARTGLVEHLLLSNLRLDTRCAAGNWWGNGEPVCIMATFHNSAAYRDAIPGHDFPVNIRDVQFVNVSCTGENAIGIVGEGENVADIRFTNLSFALKDSDNLLVKGRLIDISPSPQAAYLPDDGKPYWLHAQGVRDVCFQGVQTSPFHGQALGVSIKDSENISIH